jgi:thiosulfate/3-mercaptopyruvate sulfurtransferase
MMNIGVSGVWVARAVALAVLLMSSGCAATHRTPLGDVIEPEALAGRMTDKSRGRLIVVDVRDAAAFNAGHIAGAVHADPNQWRDESLASETGLSHDALWQGRIGALGITGDDAVIVYDDGRMTEAARVWFIFQHFGVADVAVLDGGYPALEPLIASKRIVADRAPTPVRPVQFRPALRMAGTIGLVERQRVLRAIEQHEAQVFDARTSDEYVGKDLRKNSRGGRIPTAINLPHTQLLNEQGRLKSPEILAKLFEQAGFRRGQPLITHCDGGGRASLAALAAARAGYGPVMNYYLSFGDWAADASCPVEASDK